MNILAISGSIREGSSNQALLKAVHKILPVSTKWNEFQPKTLPYFDPALQFGENVPAVVQEFRTLASQADCIFISSPEYAHGIPGILKNALEWLVCEETMQKKVAVIIASPSGGEFVHEHLLETLRTMDLQPSEERVLVVRNARNQVTFEGSVTAPELAEQLREFCKKF